MEYLDYRTDMYDVDAGSCGSLTDVVFGRNDNLIVDGIVRRGYSFCWSYVYLLVCEQAWAVVNLAEIAADSAANAPGDFTNLVVNIGKTIRHEMGHTVGLGHGLNDVMQQGWVDNNFFVWWSFSDHNRDHVDGWYT